MSNALSQATVFHKIFAFLILTAACFFLYRCSLHIPERGLVRQQFHLEQEVTFERLYFFGKNRLVTPPSIEAIIHLSDEQFTSYKQNLDNPEIWKAIPINYYKTDWLGNYTTTFSGNASESAYKWKVFTRNDAGVWGSVSSDAIQKMKNGKIFCLSWYQPKNSNIYKAVSCDETPEDIEKQIFVKGALDYDTKLLHAYIHGIGSK